MSDSYNLGFTLCFTGPQADKMGSDGQKPSLLVQSGKLGMAESVTKYRAQSALLEQPFW